uniref:Uncharacterized protein n=1 Tax=Crocodylus porosus TaxID=8502 RepID=A0A7M4DZZ3_CROPO
DTAGSNLKHWAPCSSGALQEACAGNLAAAQEGRLHPREKEKKNEPDLFFSFLPGACLSCMGAWWYRNAKYNYYSREGQ